MSRSDRRTRTLRPVDLTFVDEAPVIHTLHLDLDAAPDRVYAHLSDSPATWTWMPSVKGGRWLDDARGVGARREILLGPARITETVLAADPGIRWAYRVDESSLPMAAALLEDWRLTEIPGTNGYPARTHVSYAFCIEPLRGAGWVTRAAGVGLAQVARRAEADLNKILTTAAH